MDEYSDEYGTEKYNTDKYKTTGLSGCAAFAATLASKSPTPGGGGAAALVGALAASLGGMVAALTSGKKKYAGVQADMERLTAEADELRGALLGLVDRDAEVFAPLARAYGLPKDTPEQAAERASVLETALCEACSVPLKIMEAAARCVELNRELAQKGSALAISDAGVGACFAKAALSGASLNVYINTKLMRDRERAETLNRRAAEILNTAGARADAVLAKVTARLLGGSASA